MAINSHRDFQAVAQWATTFAIAFLQLWSGWSSIVHCENESRDMIDSMSWSTFQKYLLIEMWMIWRSAYRVVVLRKMSNISEIYGDPSWIWSVWITLSANLRTQLAISSLTAPNSLYIKMDFVIGVRYALTSICLTDELLSRWYSMISLCIGRTTVIILITLSWWLCITEWSKFNKFSDRLCTYSCNNINRLSNTWSAFDVFGQGSTKQLTIVFRMNAEACWSKYVKLLPIWMSCLNDGQSNM